MASMKASWHGRGRSSARRMVVVATAVLLASSACSDGGTSVLNAESQPGRTTIEGTASPADSDIGVQLVDRIAKAHGDGIVGDRECIADVLSKLPDEDTASLSEFFVEVVTEVLTPGAQAADNEFNVRCFLDDTFDSDDAVRWLSLSGEEVCAVLSAKSLQGLWTDGYTFTAEPGQSGVCTYVDNNGDRTTLSVLDHFVAPEDENTYLVTFEKGFSAWLGPTVYRAMRGDVTFELRFGIDMDAVHAVDDSANCVDCEGTPDQSRAKRFTGLVAEGLRALPPG